MFWKFTFICVFRTVFLFIWWFFWRFNRWFVKRRRRRWRIVTRLILIPMIRIMHCLKCRSSTWLAGGEAHRYIGFGGSKSVRLILGPSRASHRTQIGRNRMFIRHIGHQREPVISRVQSGAAFTRQTLWFATHISQILNSFSVAVRQLCLKIINLLNVRVKFLRHIGIIEWESNMKFL